MSGLASPQGLSGAEPVLEFVQEVERNRGRMKLKANGGDENQRKAVADAVQGAINRILSDTEKDKLSAAKLGELVKLIQIQGELGPERPQEINVRWVETWESKPSNEE